LSAQDTSSLADKANEAFATGNYTLAKELFTKITLEEPRNKNALLFLAAAEIKLNNPDNACEQLYKVYINGDINIAEDIMKHCPNYRNGTIQLFSKVDENPNTYTTTKNIIYLNLVT
jgi:hypothetical protein